MNSRAFAFGASLLASLLVGESGPAFAETTITVLASITERIVSWDAPSSGNVHYPTEIDRVTGTFHRTLCTPTGGCAGGGENLGQCRKGDKQF
jgi:hypothetical protein